MHVHCGANTHNCSRAKNRTSQYFVLNQSNVAFGRGHNRRSEHISDLKCIVPHSAARLIIKSECHPSPGIHLSMRDFGPSPPRLRWSRAGSQGGGRRRPRTERRASATGSRQPATGDRRQAAAHPSGVQRGQGAGRLGARGEFTPPRGEKPPIRADSALSRHCVHIARHTKLDVLSGFSGRTLGPPVGCSHDATTQDTRVGGPPPVTSSGSLPSHHHLVRVRIACPRRHVGNVRR